jgi:GT2 family glycosyltransferase
MQVGSNIGNASGLWDRYRQLGLREVWLRVAYRLRRRCQATTADIDYEEWVRRFDNQPDDRHAVVPRGVYLLLRDRSSGELDRLPSIAAEQLQIESDARPHDMEYALVVAPGQRLHPACIGVLYDEITSKGLDLVFADEDRINADGLRYEPHFKPAWDPELLLETDYVSRAFMVRRAALASVLHRPLPTQGQGYALVLRLARQLSAAAVARVPRVLSHREEDAEPESAEARRVALQDWLADEAGSSLATLDETASVPRIRWRLPASPPTVSVVIPTRDQTDYLRRCLRSLATVTDYPRIELILVDNGTRDPEALVLLADSERTGAIVLRKDEPFNYSDLVNAGVAKARGEFVCLLNNDVEVVEPGWLAEMVALALRPSVGVVGAMLVYPDRRIQHAGIIAGMHGAATNLLAGQPLGSRGYHGRALCRQQFSAVTGACMVLRKDVYLGVGGLDVAWPVSFNDVDFCLRLRKLGWQVVWTPDAVLLHHESVSRGKPEDAKLRHEVDRLRSLWSAEMNDDPAYNPNLALGDEPFRLTLMPRWLKAFATQDDRV